MAELKLDCKLTKALIYNVIFLEHKRLSLSGELDDFLAKLVNEARCEPIGDSDKVVSQIYDTSRLLSDG